MHLAKLGHETVLVDRAARPGPPRSESLAASILPICESLQLHDTINAAAFKRETRAVLLWESGTIQEKELDAAPSLLVERAQFDASLRAAAQSLGVRLIAPAAAHSPQHLSAGGWLIPVSIHDGSIVIKAGFLVDARGKRRRVWPNEGTPHTAAISAVWLLTDPSFVETRIESGDDEWFWGSNLPGGSYAATIFLDTVRVAGLTRVSRTELYQALLARSKLLRGLLRGNMAWPVWVRDATAGIAETLIGRDFIRVGDTAMSIDPLSSQGLQTAMLSAIQGSVVVHTMLTACSDSLAAIEFYRERRHAAFRQATSNAARIYGNCSRKSSFWLRRRLPQERVPSAVPRAPEIAIPVTCRLRVAQALQIVECPVLVGAIITRASALRHPALEHPIAYRGNISIAPLVGEIDEPLTPDQILRRWTLRIPRDTAMDIMNWMYRVGILVPNAGASVCAEAAAFV
jgi:flavin-dependent dehydrogenase